MRPKKNGYEAREMRDGLTYSAMGKTEADALERLQKRLWLTGKIEPKVMTLGDMMTLYRHSLKYTSTQYQKSAYYQLLKFSHMAHLPLDSFNRDMIQSVFDSLAPKYKLSSLKTTLKHIRSLFELAIDDGRIAANPCRRIKLPKETFVPKEIFTPDEIAKLIETSQGYAILPFIVLGSLLGVGPGEVAKLEAKHFKGGYLTIPGTKTKSRYRVLPLPTGVYDLVKHTGMPWLFRSSNANRGLSEACLRAGIERGNRTVYSFRHSCASGLAELECPHDYIARILGHANSTMTMHYSQVSADALSPYLEKWAKKIYTFFGNYLGTATNQ